MTAAPAPAKARADMWDEEARHYQARADALDGWAPRGEVALLREMAGTRREWARRLRAEGA